MHGQGIDELLAIEQKGKVYYYHFDGLGSITALTDNKGKVVQRYDYDSFGNMKHHGHKVKQPYTYTGREWDRETGLYYYRARYYDAKVGRFISKDPIGFFGGVNLHTYVGNNPMYWIDPWGLVIWPGSGIVTSPFGNRIDPITNAQSFHNGIDIGNPLGGAVVASDRGNVISITPSPNGANQIIIRNDDGSISGYAHTNPSVQVGQHINEGNVIGNTDLSGRSTGGHVHYTYRPSAGQPYQNPLNHLPTQNNYPGRRCR
ncbi:MAG: RHS repeat-associated core domain-containing protein [Nitrospinota bacterium]